jgi:excisionase family DNA binding protein
MLLKVDEVAEITGLSRTVLYELMRSGRLESVRIGAARRVPADAIAAFVEQLRDESREPTPAA